MKRVMALLLLLSAVPAFSQHCPWDCTGMILIKTDASYAEMERLDPALVDAQKKLVIDTLYGTGKESFDSCRFLYFDEFIKYRTQRIQLHSFYRYDTMLVFAANQYVVHYNYCKYQWDTNGVLYVRFNDPSAGGTYRYIEIPASRRVHLHDYNSEIRNHESAKILESIAPNILILNKKDWGLE